MHSIAIRKIAIYLAFYLGDKGVYFVGIYAVVRDEKGCTCPSSIQSDALTR